jgi:hypothetical protein
MTGHADRKRCGSDDQVALVEKREAARSLQSGPPEMIILAVIGDDRSQL